MQVPPVAADVPVPPPPVGANLRDQNYDRDDFDNRQLSDAEVLFLRINQGEFDPTGVDMLSCLASDGIQVATHYLGNHRIFDHLSDLLRRFAPNRLDGVHMQQIDLFRQHMLQLCVPFYRPTIPGWEFVDALRCGTEERYIFRSAEGQRDPTGVDRRVMTAIQRVSVVAPSYRMYVLCCRGKMTLTVSFRVVCADIVDAGLLQFPFDCKVGEAGVFLRNVVRSVNVPAALAASVVAASSEVVSLLSRCHGQHVLTNAGGF